MLACAIAEARLNSLLVPGGEAPGLRVGDLPVRFGAGAYRDRMPSRVDTTLN